MQLRLMGIGANVDIGGGVLIHGFLDHSGLVMYFRHSLQPYYTADRFRVGIGLCYNKCLKKRSN